MSPKWSDLLIALKKKLQWIESAKKAELPPPKAPLCEKSPADPFTQDILRLSQEAKGDIRTLLKEKKSP